MSRAKRTVGTISRPGKRWTARRRLHSGDPKAIARHNQQVGNSLHAFNVALASFFLIFWRLAAPDDIYLAKKLWDEQGSDNAKLRIVEPYVSHCIKRKAIQNSLLWSLKTMHKLSNYRNDVVHSDVFADLDGIIPGIGTKTSRSERLTSSEISRICNFLPGDLSAIANYVGDLYLDLGSNNAWPSTKRPQLKLVHSKSSHSQDLARQAKSARRERQRQASRQKSQSDPS